MRGVVLVLLVACYSAPDYGGTTFKCDDKHGCPAGQQCVAGVCGGSIGNMGDGVKCGTGHICTSGEKCCAGFMPFYCVAATDSCPGLTGTCDGVEDCSANQRCCINNNTNVIACGAEASCQDIACTNASDCPASRPICCTVTAAVEPWGRCELAC